MEQQKNQGLGAKIIDKLAYDLTKAFPNMKGFSSRKLKHIHTFAEAYSDMQIAQQFDL